jgi:hypothetical protein
VSKTYSLICNEPLSEFDNNILEMLNDFASSGVVPRAAIVVALTDSDEVATFYHKATMQDMMIAKGFIDLDIQNDNILGNLPHYIEQAAREGLLDDDYEEEDE